MNQVTLNRAKKIQHPEIVLALQQTMSNSLECFLIVLYLGPPHSHTAEVELGY